MAPAHLHWQLAAVEEFAPNAFDLLLLQAPTEMVATEVDEVASGLNQVLTTIAVAAVNLSVNEFAHVCQEKINNSMCLHFCISSSSNSVTFELRLIMHGVKYDTVEHNYNDLAA